MDRPIAEFMSSPVFTVGVSQSVAEARRRMIEHETRHLVVLRGGHLRGIVSDRDLTLAEGILAEGAAEETTVEDVMSADTFEIGKDAPTSQVAQTMAGKRIGAAIIVEDGQPVGIFTTTDALRALAATLA